MLPDTELSSFLIISPNSPPSLYSMAMKEKMEVGRGESVERKKRSGAEKDEGRRKRAEERREEECYSLLTCT